MRVVVVWTQHRVPSAVTGVEHAGHWRAATTPEVVGTAVRAPGTIPPGSELDKESTDRFDGLAGIVENHGDAMGGELVGDAYQSSIHRAGSIQRRFARQGTPAAACELDLLASEATSDLPRRLSVGVRRPHTWHQQGVSWFRPPRVS